MSAERAIIAALLVVASGCSEYPCEDETTVHEVPTISFTYDDEVRYTYWFEDGAQRITMDREQVPEAARAAVLVHVDAQTAGGLHGATGWAADVSDEEGARAAYVPMAIPRSAAFAGWSGSWAARWVSTRSNIMLDDALVAEELQDEIEAPDDDEKPESDDPLDPMRLIENLRGEEGEEDMPSRPAAPKHAPKFLAKALENEGLSIDGARVTRALRVVGARQPFPRDFGLSVDVHPVWVFVSQDCTACDAAMAWLDDRGIGYHAMLVTDPTNAATLKSISNRADTKPAVPMLWRHTKLLRGFDAKTWQKELR